MTERRCDDCGAKASPSFRLRPTKTHDLRDVIHLCLDCSTEHEMERIRLQQQAKGAA